MLKFRHGLTDGLTQMIKIKMDNDTFLVVDFEGILSPREEEITAWRFSGTSQPTISKIIGTTPDTIKKQQRRAYEKTEVDGADSPINLLMCKAFQNGWARFVVGSMVLLCLLPTLRVSSRTSTRTNSISIHNGRPELLYVA